MSDLRYWTGSFALTAETDQALHGTGGLKDVAAHFVGLASSRPELERFAREIAAQQGFRVLRTNEARPLVDMEATAEEVMLARRVSTRVPVAFGTMRQPREAEPAPLRDAAAVTYEETSWDRLEQRRDAPLWALVDGVSWPEFSGLVSSLDTDHCCLYSSPDPATRTLAPWLVAFEPGTALAEAIRSRKASTHSFVLMQGAGSIWDLRGHLRRFTMIQLPDRDEPPVYFRFYDPRVLTDLLSALDPGSLTALLGPFSQVILPLSCQCLPPRAAKLSPAITPFDNEEDLAGRLLSARLPGTGSPKERRAFRLSMTEFDRLGAAQRQRAVNKLARRLHDADTERFAASECLKMAGSASEIAGGFGLKSVSSVTLLARCLLNFGPEFWKDDTEASRILNDRISLAWQKTDRLRDWMVRARLRQLSESLPEIKELDAWS